MYNDSSSNPLTALQGVDMVLGGLGAGLASALAPGVDYGALRRSGVSASDYNAMVVEYNRLAGELNRVCQLLALREKENELLRRLMAYRN